LMGIGYAPFGKHMLPPLASKQARQLTVSVYPREVTPTTNMFEKRQDSRSRFKMVGSYFCFMARFSILLLTSSSSA
jgi:hypothetical protein